jgi:hypothetical protein
LVENGRAMPRWTPAARRAAPPPRRVPTISPLKLPEKEHPLFPLLLVHARFQSWPFNTGSPQNTFSTFDHGLFADGCSWMDGPQGCEMYQFDAANAANGAILSFVGIFIGFCIGKTEAIADQARAGWACSPPTSTIQRCDRGDSSFSKCSIH